MLCMSYSHIILLLGDIFFVYAAVAAATIKTSPYMYPLNTTFYLHFYYINPFIVLEFRNDGLYKNNT